MTCQEELRISFNFNFIDWLTDYLEENDHALQESLKIEDAVETLGMFDVHEERHSEDRVDKHDQHQQ